MKLSCRVTPAPIKVSHPQPQPAAAPAAQPKLKILKSGARQ
jgi:hypothetical protein